MSVVTKVGRPELPASAKKDQRVETYVPHWLFLQIKKRAAATGASRSQVLREMLMGLHDRRSEPRTAGEIPGAN